jgi:hypothetical protein
MTAGVMPLGRVFLRQFAFLPSREQTQGMKTSIPAETSKNAYTVPTQPI